MIDLLSLLKDTNAYKIVKGDKENNALSHAYLLLCADEVYLEEYLKIFASMIVCREGFPCGKCRACRLIGEKIYSDVYFFPEGENNSIVVEDITRLIDESYLKPVESDRKVFVLKNAQTMNASAQNKLLKTLEEPPENVHIILGATSEFALLPTIKSRVKKIEIPAFTDEKLFNALSSQCEDGEKLKTAICCGDGTVGKTLALYGDKNLENITEVALSVLTEMNSSKDVLRYSTLITSLKCDIKEFLSVLELLLRDLLVIKEGREDLCQNKLTTEKLKQAKKFSTGSVIHAIETVEEGYNRLKFNANATMLTDWLLFQILEGKYKWQKLLG